MLKKKMILVGIDSLMPNLVEKFIGEDKLPHIRQLMDKGVFAEGLPSLPTLTPTNWTTIVTGAEPGTHGVTCYKAHLRGDPLDYSRDGFLSGLCKAEQLWQTAAKVGRKSIIIDYPNSYPVNSENVMHVGEHGAPNNSLNEIASATCYTSRPIKGTFPVRLERANNWKNVPSSHLHPLEGVLRIRPHKIAKLQVTSDMMMEKGETVTYFVLILAEEPKEYDTVLICPEKDANSKITKMSVGEWSDWIVDDFKMERRGTVEATFKLKLLELPQTESQGYIKFFVTQIYPTRGFTSPGYVAEELVKNCGPFLSHAYHNWPLLHEWCDEQTYMEQNSYHSQWFANALAYLGTNYEWDLIFLKWHSPDTFKHTLWGGIDPISDSYDPSKADHYWDLFRQNYQMVDRIVQAALKIADEDTIIVLISDHGHIAHKRSVFINNILAKDGLLEYDEEGNVNWAKTKAYAQRMMYVYINLKGRDPTGIVDSDDYQDVQTRIIKSLLDTTSPEDGTHPIKFAFRKSEAVSFGLYGDRVGDVIYGMEAGYTGIPNKIRENGDIVSKTEKAAVVWGLSGSHHGQYLPATTYSIGTICSTIVIAGPGLKRGYRRDNPVPLRDIAPTLSHILGIPCPAQCEGGVIWDILQ